MGSSPNHSQISVYQSPQSIRRWYWWRAASPGGSSGGFAWSNIVNPLIRSVSRPIVWAPILGLGFAYSGLNLPSCANRSLATIGDTADGAALVLTGLVVSAQMFEIGAGIVLMLFLKFFVQPALALMIARLLSVPTEQLRYVTLMGAIPAASAAWFSARALVLVPTGKLCPHRIRA